MGAGMGTKWQARAKEGQALQKNTGWQGILCRFLSPACMLPLADRGGLQHIVRQKIPEQWDKCSQKVQADLPALPCSLIL